MYITTHGSKNLNIKEYAYRQLRKRLRFFPATQLLLGRVFHDLVAPCLNKYLRLFLWLINTSCFLLYSIIFMRCEGPVRAADVHCTWSPQGAATHWWLSNSHLPHIRIKTQNIKTIRTRENHYWRPVLVTLSLNQLLFVRDDDNVTVNIPLMAIGNLHKVIERNDIPNDQTTTLWEQER